MALNPKFPHHDYSKEPEREVESLHIQKNYPFNAEPLLPYLVQSFLTPPKHFFKRNHGPIPLLDAEKHRVYIEILSPPEDLPTTSRKGGLSLSVAQLRNDFPKRTITSALQCAGNRREGLAKVKHVKGVLWKDGTVSNATWSGARLSEVLYLAGLPTNWADTSMATWHVDMEATGDCEETARYGSSIPLALAMDRLSDVILAYEMNGETLSRDHGFPIRMIVPGVIGARSVKYLAKIRVQPGESSSFYQQRDYKILPPHAHEGNVDTFWSGLPALQEMNVQSVVCEPTDGERLVRSSPYTIRGYSLSGGGRGIQRVDVSLDGGKTWDMAQLYGQSKAERAAQKTWSWTLWSLRIPRWPEPQGDTNSSDKVEVVCRAWDDAGNTQPENPVWNYRGVMNNAWHRVGNLSFYEEAKM